MAASPVSGIVSAGILVSAQSPLGEIDVEVLGGDKTYWQTNVFRIDQGESGPLYGVFGQKEPYAGSGTVSEMHTYTIDWSPQRVRLPFLRRRASRAEGRAAAMERRRARGEDAQVAGYLHQRPLPLPQLALAIPGRVPVSCSCAPPQPLTSAVQVGIWDASGAKGTSQWAHGPVNWSVPSLPRRNVEAERVFGRQEQAGQPARDDAAQAGPARVPLPMRAPLILHSQLQTLRRRSRRK